MMPTWWCHDIQILFALQALYEGNPLVTGGPEKWQMRKCLTKLDIHVDQLDINVPNVKFLCIYHFQVTVQLFHANVLIWTNNIFCNYSPMNWFTLSVYNHDTLVLDWSLVLCLPIDMDLITFLLSIFINNMKLYECDHETPHTSVTSMHACYSTKIWV